MKPCPCWQMGFGSIMFIVSVFMCYNYIAFDDVKGAEHAEIAETSPDWVKS